MPLGYIVAVALLSWGVACALTRWPVLGSIAAIPALLVNELPFLVAYLLIADTVLAWSEGDLATPGGVTAAGVALLSLGGLAVIVWRATRVHAAMGNTGPARRPWARILCAPLPPGRSNVIRVSDCAYGDAPRQVLDVHHRRDRPSGRPVLLNIHGGGFRSGSKTREAKPLVRYLTSQRGMVCVSMNYRLQPHVTLADQVADVRAAIAWIRAHIADYGGDASTLFVTGSSAGAYLALAAISEGETGIAGLICRYGYYGGLAPRGDLPPTLVIHGDKDILVHASHARAFADRARTATSSPVAYAELPGAHHNFDMFESIRSSSINTAVDAFIAKTA